MSFLDNKFHKNAKVHLKPYQIPLITTTTITDRAFFVDKPGFGFYVADCRQYTHTKAGTVTWSGVIIPNGTGIITAGALTVHSTPEQLALAISKYLVGGKIVEKGAATGITFSANHVVSASKFGVILVMSDNAGTITTKVPSATQAYDTAGQATAQLSINGGSLAADSGKVAIAYILIAAKAQTWTANTDDLTDGSDLTTATITNIAAATKFASAITAAASLTEEGVTLSTVESVRTGKTADYIVLIYTTDGSGALTHGFIKPTLRARPVGGEVV